MHQVRRAILFTGMPSLLEASSGIRFAVVLAGKNKSDVAAFIAKRHVFGKRILPRHPADVHPQRFVDPRTCDVKGLVTESVDHACELRLSPHARHFRDQSDYPRHTLSFRSLPPMTT